MEQESYNRLVYHAFIEDAQSSIALSTNPLISFAEMKIPMPASACLWSAGSAEEWKSHYLNTPYVATATVSLVQYLSEEVDLQYHHDTHFCQLVILCSVWGMIWQYHQLRIALDKSRHTNAALSLQHQEIRRGLDQFWVNRINEGDSSHAEVTLIYELLQMHLHMPFQEMELFAGKGTQDDGRHSLPLLLQWASSEESREAIWSAGQLLRAAKDVEPARLRGFFAIAMYQAALTLWVYSVVKKITGGESSGQPSNSDLTCTFVCLNGPSTSATKRFISKGRPGICIVQPSGLGDVARTPILLADQDSVIHLVLDILKDNFEGCEAFPPLVENLIQLLRNLGRAAASIRTEVNFLG